jgi:hypothetical protein
MTSPGCTLVDEQYLRRCVCLDGAAKLPTNPRRNDLAVVMVDRVTTIAG